MLYNKLKGIDQWSWQYLQNKAECYFFSMIERDVVKVNQNQDTAFFPLIMLLLIQLLNSLRLSSSDIFTLPPKLKV